MTYKPLTKWYVAGYLFGIGICAIIVPLAFIAAKYLLVRTLPFPESVNMLNKLPIFNLQFYQYSLLAVGVGAVNLSFHVLVDYMHRRKKEAKTQ